MIDRYTKTVLTIIAGALVWIGVALTSVPVANATQSANSEVQRVNIVEIGGVPVGGRNPRTGTKGELPVRVMPE